MRWIVVSVALLVATGCSSSGGQGGSPGTAPTGGAPSPTDAPSTTAARTPGLYVIELTTGAIEPLPGVAPEAVALGAAVSADGTRIAFDAEVEGRRQIFVMNADGTGLERVTDDAEAVSPTWSPDGARLAYIGFGEGATRAVVVLDLRSGATRVVTSEEEDVFGADWSSDGGSIVYQAPKPEGWLLRSVDLRTGETITLCCTREDSIASDADWSPDGELLVFGYATPEDNFALYTMTPSGEAVTPVEPADPARYHGHPVWSPNGTTIAYQGAPGVWVLDPITGVDRMVDADMWGPAWLDDDTLIVELPPEA